MDPQTGTRLSPKTAGTDLCDEVLPKPDTTGADQGAKKGKSHGSQARTGSLLRSMELRRSPSTTR